MIAGQAQRVAITMLIHDKGITIITVQSVAGGKPHDTTFILMYLQDGQLRQTTFKLQRREREGRNGSIQPGTQTTKAENN